MYWVYNSTKFHCNLIMFYKEWRLTIWNLLNGFYKWKLASIFNFLINRFSLRKNVSLIDKKNIQLKINKFLMFFKQQDPSCEQIIIFKLFFVQYVIWCLAFCMGVMSVGHWQRIETTHVFFSVTPKVRSNHQVLPNSFDVRSYFCTPLYSDFVFPFHNFLLSFIFVKSDLFIQFFTGMKKT